MTNEEKQLLLQDLYARLLHRINVLTKDDDKGHIIGVDDIENGLFEIHIIEDGDSYTYYESIENFKPYLRQMSSMTEEEKEEEDNTVMMFLQDFYNSHHLDYRGLIEKGLALEAPKGMYKTE